ncbi:MAG TPA: type I polyketide synthase, partial [Thermoanaerobaculia bacterium]
RSFERIQAILQSKPAGRVLVQIVAANHQEQALFAGLSGLLRTAAMENPRFTGQLILTEAGTTADRLAARLAEEKRRGRDTLVRYERGSRQVLRWKEAGQAAAPVSFRDRGVYLITGGLGALGLLFANEILARTAETRVVLTGRAGWTPEIEARLDAMSSQPGRLIYRQVDLADRDDVERLITGIRDEYRQLSGIIHAAGMTADNAIVKKSGAELLQVFEPKVTGTYNLDCATRAVELDFFVVFSSIAAVLGNVGQADYAAANGFEDAFAILRNQKVAAKKRHGLTRSINWSLWQSGGMAVDRASWELVQQSTGMQPLDTTTGIEAFYRGLALPHDRLLVVEGVEPKMTEYLQKARIFEPAAAQPRVASSAPAAAAKVNLGQLQQQLKAMLAKVVRIDVAAMDIDQPFVELGLDSFLGAELIAAVNKAFGTELSHLRLFDYSTIREFAQYLEGQIRVATPAPVSVPAAPAVPSYPVLERRRRHAAAKRAQSEDRIAIVGMSGRYPKANDLHQYWENLAQGRNGVTEVPSSRWDVSRFFDTNRTLRDKSYSKWLGAVDDVDRFDPLFFRISPQEAEYIDPQHRLFLQESYRAFEDAGYSTTTLSNRKCGVYLGISTSDYLSLMARNGLPSAPVTSNSYAIAAARIAYYLNLKGPAISVDTACSSSLVAIHLASQALLGGEIDMALAGGVSLWLSPESYVAMSQAGMFSPSGQCKTFDDSADGIVNGEGIGAVVLKRLSDAERDGDTIYGVILGSGINQDGRTNGITAPSVNSQIELERSVYARFGIDPETITYVETHGTGTKLGDPIELEALATVFQEKTSKKNFCALGSVKSNIGHTTAAAGVAGLQKVLLSMRHRTLVPTLNVKKENARFDFARSPFYVSRETKPWSVENGTPRRAAVSSFGFSGTNAHLVVEEYRGSEAPLSANERVIVPLSARTPEALLQRSRDLLAFLRTAQQPVDLSAVAYTLQTGREPMEERLGFVAGSTEELAEKLSAFIAGQRNVEGVLTGRVEPGSEGSTLVGGDSETSQAVGQWVARRNLVPLLDLWVRGVDFDWNRLYAAAKPRRVSLPAYPFAKERCWIEERRVEPRLPIKATAQPLVACDSPLVAGDVLTVQADRRSIESIFNQLADDTIDSGDAVEALKALV